MQQNEKRAVLVTGGAGYIGSHVCVELIESGYAAVVVDGLQNANEESIKRVKEITAAHNPELFFYKLDLRDKDALEKVFASHRIYAVIHLAGLKAVGESVELPLKYYENNLDATFALLEAMHAHSVPKFVFSSSATVYGDPHTVPITEEFPLKPTNPYGRTKYFIEEILKDYVVAANKKKTAPQKGNGTHRFDAVLLRYFNPIGAHVSGRIGEDPKGIPNNLLPYICQVAVGRLEKLRVFGKDWPTHDGTGVRDYIHVVDLAKGHISAIKKLEADEEARGPHHEQGGTVAVYNLGTGKGYSVMDVVQAMRKASGKEIPVEFVERRPGDIATCYADPAKAAQELGWEAKYGIEEMCAHAWFWQSNNPHGYEQ